MSSNASNGREQPTLTLSPHKFCPVTEIDSLSIVINSFFYKIKVNHFFNSIRSFLTLICSRKGHINNIHYVDNKKWLNKTFKIVLLVLTGIDVS